MGCDTVLGTRTNNPANPCFNRTHQCTFKALEHQCGEPLTMHGNRRDGVLLAAVHVLRPVHSKTRHISADSRAIAS